MKRFATLLALAVLCAPAVALAAAGPDDEAEAQIVILKKAESEAVAAARWDAFGKRLVGALREDHDGVRVAALQLVIRYGENVNVRAAVPAVMKLYREHEDQDVRRMAIVALGQMRSGRAVGFLRLSAEYEENDTLRRTIHAVVAAYEAKQQT